MVQLSTVALWKHNLFVNYNHNSTKAQKQKGVFSEILQVMFKLKARSNEQPFLKSKFKKYLIKTILC